MWRGEELWAFISRACRERLWKRANWSLGKVTEGCLGDGDPEIRESGISKLGELYK